VALSPKTARTLFNKQKGSDGVVMVVVVVYSCCCHLHAFVIT